MQVLHFFCSSWEFDRQLMQFSRQVKNSDACIEMCGGSALYLHDGKSDFPHCNIFVKTLENPKI